MAPPADTGYSGAIVGPGINGWEVQGNTAISPPIRLKYGESHKLSVFWRLANIRRTPDEFFRIYAIDNRGGRKLLITQPSQDIAEVGNADQLYEENINRYIGPPIRFMFETSPGLQAIIEKVSY